MISKVCEEGKGTVWGVGGASFEGLSGAEDFGSGVTTIGDLEAIVTGIIECGSEPEDRRGTNEAGVKWLGKSRNAQ